MAEVAYLKLKADGKDIEGGCQEKDNKKMIEVQGFEHTITVATHRQTGAATGETMHGPIVIVKPMDRASPLLQKALNKHHEMEGEIHFYRSRDGKRKHWYTIKFTDARLVEVRTYKELALEGGDKPDLEQLQFRYRYIKWEHKEQNKESEADWEDK
jgi:type VI secretion system Hcp family effector